jgi:hypothetical protein
MCTVRKELRMTAQVIATIAQLNKGMRPLLTTIRAA